LTAPEPRRSLAGHHDISLNPARPFEVGAGLLAGQKTNEEEDVMRKSGYVCVVSLAVCALLVGGTATVEAGGGHGRVCRPDGPWAGPEFYYSGLGLDFAATVIYTSTSFWGGTVTQEWVARWAEWGPITHGIDDGAGGTQMTGVWKRTGKRTLQYTVVGYALDALGAPVGKTVNSGKVTLSRDCKTLEAVSESDFYVPGPSAEEPWVRASTVFFPDGHAHFPPMAFERMKLEPVCEEDHTP
jgi:hypothetical protein